MLKTLLLISLLFLACSLNTLLYTALCIKSSMTGTQWYFFFLSNLSSLFLNYKFIVEGLVNLPVQIIPFNNIFMFLINEMKIGKWDLYVAFNLFNREIKSD